MNLTDHMTLVRATAAKVDAPLRANTDEKRAHEIAVGLHHAGLALGMLDPIESGADLEVIVRFVRLAAALQTKLLARRAPVEPWMVKNPLRLVGGAR